METKNVQRRYDLDWLRVLGILFVFVYHSNRFFNLEDWHVKNAVTYQLSEILNLIAVSWMMPLMFAISGASLYYAMGKGGAGKFIKDKVLRLLVPLVTLGTVVFGVLQMYLESLSHGEFSGSFFAFLPQYFQPGNLEWWGVHLLPGLPAALPVAQARFRATRPGETRRLTLCTGRSLSAGATDHLVPGPDRS
jgi:peptidoglycan/LPS O-acetylase OafA/YrhL